MKLKITLFVFIFTQGCFISVFAQKAKWYVQTGVGISSQDMNWSIAGNQQGTSPNILSEVRWNNLQAMAYSIQIDYQINQKFGITLLTNYNDQSKGSGSDSDYAQDNRASKFTNQEFSSNKGYVYDVQLKANYQLPHLGRLLAQLSAGFEQLGQKFYMQDLPNVNMGLRSTYTSKWNGGTIGASVTYPIQSFYITGYYDFGVYDYRAKANWNLQEEMQQPVSFRHLAVGFKHYGKLKIGYKLSDRFDIGISLSKYYGFTNEGTDKLYMKGGNIKKTQFNNAEFNQLTGLLNIGVNF